MSLKIGKKLKTASLNSKFTGSERVYFDLFTFEKRENLMLLLKYKFTHQQPQGRFSVIKKNNAWKKLFFFTLIQKYNSILSS